MNPSSLKTRLKTFMEGYSNLSVKQTRELATGTIEIIGNFFYELCIPSTWHLLDIERNKNEFVFIWASNSEEAVCSNCKTLSHRRSKMYFKRPIQDLPMAGMTVYHKVIGNRFFCDNPECSVNNFYEQFNEIAEKDAMLSDRLKDFIIRYAIESSANATSTALKQIGIIASRDTTLRLIKKKGSAVVEQNLQRDDVNVISVDDINLRKGNSSTACSVFIDGETHRVLVIVQGATGQIAERVIQQFPSAPMVSRDRGTAFAAAAAKAGKIQVADGFHLVQNIHQVVKDVLSQEISHDLFVREGDGWIRLVDSASEESEDVSASDDRDCLVVCGPATLAENDVEQRIHLAGLATRQANKYRKTMKILEFTENGLRTPEIAKKMAMTKQDVCNYRKNAPETVKNVETRIDEYYQLQTREQWEYHQKTIAKKARPSSESIVEPYKETVLTMFKEGKNHRNIYPVIKEQGYEGSKNAIYQYLIKYALENNIPYGRNQRIISPEERIVDGAPPRPQKISIERTSRSSIYARLLEITAAQREEIKQAIVEKDLVDSKKKKEKSVPKERVNKSNYADSVAEIIFDSKEKGKPKKKLSEEAFTRIETRFPIIARLSAFLLAFYDILMREDVIKLDCFIHEYQNDCIEPISVFTSGLKKDYEAVKNCLLYPKISNGPIEGTNGKIKMIRRRGYGRAGIELLNALLVLPWYYKDLEKNSEEKLKLAV